MNKTHQGTNWTRAEAPATAEIVPFLRTVLMVLLLGINDEDVIIKPNHYVLFVEAFSSAVPKYSTQGDKSPAILHQSFCINLSLVAWITRLIQEYFE